MEPRSRLILVPQLPIRMRYQEWWPREFVKNLAPAFKSVVTLGAGKEPIDCNTPGFSMAEEAVVYELRQVEEYLALCPNKNDTLLHLDLSFPGLFHEVLYHRPPGRSFVFCHASARNRYDIFQPVRASKWRAERAHASMYDRVLVATEYHKRKLNLANVVSLGALPDPPQWMRPPRHERVVRQHTFCSTVRQTCQKVDMSVEHELRKLGLPIRRREFRSWHGYFQFLDRYRFMLSTAKEETYGYGVVDAVLRGCIPIAPKAYSFPELLPERLLYDANAPATEKAKQIQKIARRAVWTRVVLKNRRRIDRFYETLIGVLQNGGV